MLTVEQMTIEEVKSELKSRKLPHTGTLDQLRRALQDAIEEEELLALDEDDLLQLTAEAIDIDLDALDEDELLGYDGNKALKADTTQIPIETKQKAAVKPVREVKPAPVPSAQTGNAPVITANRQKAAIQAPHSLPLYVPKRRVQSPDEAKRLRAERFGIPVVPSSASKSRSERFGAKAPAKPRGWGVQNKPIIKKKEPQNIASRITIATTKIMGRPAWKKSPQMQSEAELQMLKKRAARFGIAVDPTTGRRLN